jgi:two-component system chemotaxis sensor kinase CheA
MVDEEFLHIFLDEAAETLERWESVCLKLESAPTPDLLNELFRYAHNIKGSSKSIGLAEFGKLVHAAEDLITGLKNETVGMTDSATAILLECQAALVQWVEGLRQDSNAGIQSDNLIRRLQQATSGKVLDAAEPAAFGFFDEVDASQTPAAQDNVPRELGTMLIQSGHATSEQIENAVSSQYRKLGEVLVEKGVVSQKTVDQALAEQKSTGHVPDETIRVSLKKLDSVIRLIGELSIQQTIVRNCKTHGRIDNQAMNDAIELSHKVIQDLQSEAMALRMQPLESLFRRMERVCRDVARQQGKSIAVILEGTDVELDKSVIEQIKDPLVHILRNAVDHGLEAEGDRIAAQKPKQGCITITGAQTAANVTIRISDDGKGLNRKRILAKAIERGIILSSAKLTDHETQQLIFMPGFSTAEKVTEVSGRGVGMDVVRRAVSDLGGTITIESVEGKGTAFHIVLPSTLSILDAVVVEISNQLFSIPVQDIDEVIDLNSVHMESTTQRGRIFSLRGEIFPVERLDQYIPVALSRSKDNHGIALISRRTLPIALEVDRVVGQQSIVVRKLEGHMADIPGFTGATILASGEPSMIIHLSQVINSFDQYTKKQGVA